jgi:hypothetical protein
MTKNVFLKCVFNFANCLLKYILICDHHYENSLPPPLSAPTLHHVSTVNEFVCECLCCCLFAVFESSETRLTGCSKVVKSLHSLTTCHSHCLSLNPICLRSMASCSGYKITSLFSV